VVVTKMLELFAVVHSSDRATLQLAKTDPAVTRRLLYSWEW